MHRHHHNSRQQGPPQPSSKWATHHDQQQQQDCFKCPSPNHPPDELVSAMATMDLRNRPNLKKEVPRFHSVQQTAGTVIDFGHLDYGHLDHDQQQHQDCFKCPSPNHLPDELVSAMATMDLRNRPNLKKEVPRFHSVLQTAGTVIDYGHLDYGHLDYANLSATADGSSVGESMSERQHAWVQPFEPRSGPELEKKTSEEEFSLKSTVLITGLPEGWTESDVIRLCKPFGAPTDIILATQLGKVLLSMPDTQMVEMVKNHSITPIKINDSELKMSILEQSIGLNIPVALYNLLNPPKDTVNVHWNRLLVIRNVPNTPSAPSEVQTLVERIGKVHNTLVLLNCSMIICEMVSVRAAMSTNRHYRRCPCIVQSNRLYFESRPDKTRHVWGPSWRPPWRAASLDPFKGSADDDKANPTVPTADKDSTLEENGKFAYLVEVYHEGKLFAIYCKLCDYRIKSKGTLSIDPKHIKSHLKGKRHKKLSILYRTYEKTYETYEN